MAICSMADACSEMATVTIGLGSTMTNEERDAQFDVVFDGTGELLAARPTKTNPIWEGRPRTESAIPPKEVDGGWSKNELDKANREKRTYNKSGRYAKNPDFWQRYETKDGIPYIEETHDTN